MARQAVLDEWSVVAELEPWVRKRYLIIKEHFGDREFTREDVMKLFEQLRKRLEKEGAEEEAKELTTVNVSEFLSVLRRVGLIKVIKDETDYRKSYYKLVHVKDTKVTRDKLISLLKSAADQIRGGIDYKSLLLFLFYKALSDKWVKLAERYESQGKPRIHAYILANESYYRLYDLENGKLLAWHEVVKSKDTIKEIANALIRISEMNKELADLKKLVDVLGLIGFIKEDNLYRLEMIVNIFNKVDFSEFDHDLLGDAYEWILSYFAPQKAKEGEVYTPREVIRLIVKMLDIEDGSTVLDPACGSGGMLIEAYRYVREKVGENLAVKLLGQELNEITATLCKMNLVLHGIKDFDIKGGYDSLLNPQFEEGSADYVLANPPWNQDGYDEMRLSDKKVKHIYKYGYTNKQSADWAWIQLMLYLARKKVGIVLDEGALFRTGAEGRIRKGIVERDLIECIVLLPEKLFYNTGARGIVMILNKDKPEERKNKIMFINAVNEYEQHPEVRRLNRLNEKHISKIVDAYKEFKDIDGFARVVSIEEIKKNDYNLNVTLYVFPEVEEEKIDLKVEMEKLKEVESREKELMSEVVNYVDDVLRVM